MKVFLLKDVEKVGLAGEMIQVADGFGRNLLIARKLAVEVTPENEASFAKRKRLVEKRQEVIETKTSILAERIKSLVLTYKTKVHDEGQLYGSVLEGDIADLLAKNGVSVSKNQIIIDKGIKKIGTYKITVKLSSKLQPVFTLKISAEAAA
jgi:large subunit ribosomal protein L9